MLLVSVLYTNNLFKKCIIEFFLFQLERKRDEQFRDVEGEYFDFFSFCHFVEGKEREIERKSTKKGFIFYSDEEVFTQPPQMGNTLLTSGCTMSEVTGRVVAGKANRNTL